MSVSNIDFDFFDWWVRNIFVVQWEVVRKVEQTKVADTEPMKAIESQAFGFAFPYMSMAELVSFNIEMNNFQVRVHFVDQKLVLLAAFRLHCSNVVLSVDTSEQSVIGSRPDNLV